MVKLGIIAEGDSELIFIKRNMAFNKLLVDLNIEIVALIDGNGGALYNDEILNSKKAICRDAKAESILILTDSDELSYSDKKTSIDLEDVDHIVISRKAFEAWFLADTETLNKVLNTENYYCEIPENITNPFEQIRQLFIEHKNGRGIGGKTLLSAKMNKNGFDITNAAQHPNCPSAKYFVDKLMSLKYQ